MLALAWLAFAGLAWAVFRLGQEVGGTPVGLLAGAIVLVSARLGAYTATGTGDVAAAAFVFAAAVLEVRRPRRGWPVLVLLGLAGLLRPEAWLFAAAYWLWLVPARGWRERAGLAALAASGPLLWMLTDIALTGEPFYSAGSTAGLADEYGIPNTLDAVPDRLPAGAGGLVGAWLAVPLVIGAVTGIVLGRRRALAVPLALVGLSALAFVVLAIAGSRRSMRYLIIAAAGLAVLGAYGALGWRADRDAADARRWRAIGLAVLVALAALAVPQAVRWLDVRADTRESARIVERIEALGARPGGARGHGPLPADRLAGDGPAIRALGRRPAAGHRAGHSERRPGAQRVRAPGPRGRGPAGAKSAWPAGLPDDRWKRSLDPGREPGLRAVIGLQAPILEACGLASSSRSTAPGA